MTASGAGPLEGLRVVELGRFITAPLASMALADLGASVVKVESLTGDPFRAWHTGELSPRFVAYNRAKSSLAVDLRQEVQHRVVRRLVAKADVFLHNLRPAVVKEMELDYETLCAGCPQLVYCAIGGFAPGSPQAERPAFDAIGQAVTGLMGLLAPAGSPQPVGPALSDIVTGLSATQGILAALVERSRTGRGGEVAVSMAGATSVLVAEAVAYFRATGVEPDYLSRARNSQAFGLVGSDGRATVLQLSTPERFWQLLLGAIGRQDLADDPRFASYEKRVRHYEELREELQATASRSTSTAWLDRLVGAGIPCAPIATVADVSAQQGALQEVPSWGPSAPPTDGRPGGGRRPPAHGEGGDAVLAEAGFGPEEITALVQAGLVRTAAGPGPQGADRGGPKAARPADDEAGGEGHESAGRPAGPDEDGERRP